MKSSSKTSLIVSAFSLLAFSNPLFADIDGSDIAQQPLTLAAQVPANLYLVLSVEYPTNLQRTYEGFELIVPSSGDSTSWYDAGYADPKKCYEYVYDGDNSPKNHFQPKGFTSNGTCSGGQWSGQLLNWANTSTIDSLRKVLTGGNRVVDVAGSTWLEKARSPEDQPVTGEKIFEVGPNMVAKLGPITATGAVRFYRSNLESQVAFSNSPTTLQNNAKNATPYAGGQVTVTGNTQYRYNARVAVCVPGLLEDNCVLQKDGNYKPEGLLQKYTNKVRYSVFSYLNVNGDTDASYYPGGGVMRAAQKYISPKMLTENLISVDNPNKEWDPQTGIFEKNPDNVYEAMGVTIDNSGVINYLNKYGSLELGSDIKKKKKYYYKVYDPFGELYYAALRYIRKLPQIPDYIKLRGNPPQDIKEKAVDGFPVLSSDAHPDPIIYNCQSNIILAIADPGIWPDGNLPGSIVPNTSGGLSPPDFGKEETLNVTDAYNEMNLLEGGGIPLKTFRGRATGATTYTAAMAYWAHVNDIRTDKPDKQTIDNYFVNVTVPNDLSKYPAQELMNVLWLGAKYGGFTVPSNYDSLPKNSSTISDDQWTSGNLLYGSWKQPKNYLFTSKASLIKSSLESAFERIVQTQKSYSSGSGTSSSSYTSDGMTYYTKYTVDDEGIWSGDLTAYVMDPVKGKYTQKWSLQEKLDHASTTDRKLYTMTNVGTRGLLSSAVPFTWADLNSVQQNYLNGPINNINVTDAGALRVDYLRGAHDYEKSATNTDSNKQYFAKRTHRLADIVNSNPTYIGNKNYGFASLPTNIFSTAGSEYQAFIKTTLTTPVVAVGSNDGIFHIVNATTGSELLGFIPSDVIPNLSNLTLPDHAHRYYVDGKITAGHAYNNKWRSIVIGTTGAGGRSIFAIDVTNAGSGLNKDHILWEFTDDDLGYTLTAPIMVPLPNGKFGVIFTSGYGLADKSNAYVYIRDATTGKEYLKYKIGTIGTAATDIGELGSVLVTATTTPGVAGRLYIPDTKGHIFVIDIQDSGGKISIDGSKRLLFTAISKDGTNQPITAPLESASINGKTMVYFGTGSFYKLGDKYLPDNPQVQTFYAIADDGEHTVTRSDLLKQEITNELTASSGQKVRTVSNNTGDSTKKGWFMDLIVNRETKGKGERVIGKPTIISDKAILFNTITPVSDLCSSGGKTFSMAVGLSSGAALQSASWDLNGDGVIDGRDAVTINEQLVFPSGIEIPGIVDTPTEIIKDNKHYFCFDKGDGSGIQCILTQSSEQNGYKTWQEER